MEDNIIEKPITQVLYRQSSLETRLSPVHLSEESSDSNDEVENISSKPKIVDVKFKTPFPQRTEEEEEEESQDKVTPVYLLKGKKISEIPNSLFYNFN